MACTPQDDSASRNAAHQVGRVRSLLSAIVRCCCGEVGAGWMMHQAPYLRYHHIRTELRWRYLIHGGLAP